jgi:hypothetical protein
MPLATSRRAMMIAVLAAFSLPSRPSAADELYDSITVHFSDFGIEQPWSPYDTVGDHFGPGISQHADLFDNPRDTTARILIPMPTDDALKTLGPATLQLMIADKLRTEIQTQLDNGYRQFDVQFTEHINMWGYGGFSTPDPAHTDPNRQDLVDRFGKAGYAALSDVMNELAKATTPGHLAVFGTLGSNGTSMFARSSEAWQGMEKYIQQITLVDGRAKINDVLQALDHLASSKLRIIDNHADIWAPHDSIAQLSVAEQVQHKFPDVTLLLLTKQSMLLPAMPSINPINQHIASMADGKSLFHVEQKLDDGHTKRSVDLGDFSRAEIHPFVTAAAYQQLQGKMPPVWRAVSDPPGGRGGVEFRFVPVSAGSLETDLVRKVLGGQSNNAGVWTIQRQEGR